MIWIMLILSPSNVQSSRQETSLYVFEDNEAVIKMIIKGRCPTMRHVSRTHRVALDWLFDRINLDTKIQIKYIDTKNQLADILTKGNFTRDEWNHLLCLFNVIHVSSTECSEVMLKRTQKDSGEERVTAKSKSMMNLVSRCSERTRNVLPSTASESPGKTRHESQNPLSPQAEKYERTWRPVVCAHSSSYSEWNIDKCRSVRRKSPGEQWSRRETVEARGTKWNFDEEMDSGIPGPTLELRRDEGMPTATAPMEIPTVPPPAPSSKEYIPEIRVHSNSGGGDVAAKMKMVICGSSYADPTKTKVIDRVVRYTNILGAPITKLLNEDGKLIDTGQIIITQKLQVLKNDINATMVSWGQSVTSEDRCITMVSTVLVTAVNYLGFEYGSVHDGDRRGFTVKPTEKYVDECLDIVQLQHAKAVMTPLTEQKSLKLHDETTACDQV